MRAIQIDVARRQLVEIEIPDTGDAAQLTALQQAVGGYIELAVSFPNGDVLLVDEEGQLAHKQPAPGWFAVKGARRGPFAGNAIVTGSDDEGNTVAAKITLADLSSLIVFLS
jgi:hypothetical protein